MIRFVVVTCVLLAVLALAAFFTLKKIYPPAKLKLMAQNYVSQKLQRQFTFDSISFTWIGFTLTNAALSENQTFEDGTFIKADKLTAHVAVRPLLKKRFEITAIQANGLQVNLIAKKDGSFNFDSLATARSNNSTQNTPQPIRTNASQQEPLVITAQKIMLTDCDLVYLDEQTGLRTALNNLNIEIKNFDLNKPFETNINFTTDVSGSKEPNIRLPITLQFSTFLANGEMPKAYATISKATAQYKTIKLNLQGDIRNFEAPDADLTGSITGLNNTVLSDIAPGLSTFSLPVIDLALKATAKLKEKQATISLVKLAVQDSTLTAQGTMAWDAPTVTYNLTGSLTAFVNQLVQMTESLDNFNPAGMIQATFKASDKKNYKDVDASLKLQNVSFLYEPFVLSEVNGDILLSSANMVSSPFLSGKLNEQPFTGNFLYKTSADFTDLVFNLNLTKLVLTKWPSSSNNTTTTAQAEDANTVVTSTPDSTPMNIKANVDIGGISVPYFESNGLTLTTNLTNITGEMTQANGTLNFSIQPGKITNLDNFIKVNKIVKILLLPLGTIKKVTGLLGIELFSTSDKNQGATLPFTQAGGDYSFTNGIMNIDKTIFNSNATNISASGTANFRANELDMRVKATALTQAAPISFKITGTMDKPKGKLDVVNTVTSVVGEFLNGTTAKSATNDTVSSTKDTTDTATQVVKETVSTATNAVKELENLFKKKQTAEAKE